MLASRRPAIFQFHKGSIKTVYLFLLMFLLLLFQFHKGSIKTRSFYRQNRHQYNKLANAKLRKNNQIKCRCIIAFFSHTYDNTFIYSCINKSKNY